jgi:phospholipase/lecithinase/hemolysin
MKRMKTMLLCSVASLGLAFSSQAFAASPYSGLYVFGDSLSDSGNVFAATSVNPVPPFSTATPLSPPYFYGRFSNGPNYADVLATKLGLAQNPVGLNPSLIPGAGVPFPYGSNYAWGGASTGPAVLPVGGLKVPSIYRSTLPAADELPSQLQLFGAALQGAGTPADPNALYVLWGGGNDLRDAVQWAKDHPASAFSDGEVVVSAAIGNLQGALATLEAYGAQHVLVPNVPDLGLAPETRDWNTNPQFSLTAYATALSGNFNVRLDNLLDSFQGLSIIPFNTYAFFNQVNAHPGDFGFTNISDACLPGALSIFVGGPICATPNQYVYWDNHHPSATMGAALGQAIYAAAVPEPQIVALWLVGLATLLIFTRRHGGRRWTRQA